MASQEGDFQYTLGVEAMNEGRYDDAVKSFRSVVGLEPNNFKARYYLAYNLGKRGSMQKALVQLNQLHQEQPDDDEVLFSLAALYLENNQPSLALSFFDKAILLSPKDGLLHYYRGLTLQQLKRYEDSQVALKSAIESDSSLKVASTYFLGVAHYELKQESAAIVALSEVRHLEPSGEYAKRAKELIDRIEGVTTSDEPIFSFHGNLAIQFDTNVILEPNSLEISDEKDGRGVATLGFYFNLKPVKLAYTLYQSQHFELVSFNLQNHRLSVDWQKQGHLNKRSAKWGVKTIGNLSLLSNDFNYFSALGGVQPYVQIPWSKVFQLLVNFNLEYEDFRSLDNARDNIAAGTTFGQLVTLFGGKFFLGLRQGLQIEEAGRDFDLFRFLGEAQATLDLQHAVLTTQFSFARESYRQHSQGRNDDDLGWGFNFNRRMGKVLSLGFGYQHSETSSSVAEFSYMRDVFSLSLSGSF